MGNGQSQKEEIESQFDLEELECSSQKGTPKINVLVDETVAGFLRVYLVSEKSVELLELPTNSKPLPVTEKMRKPSRTKIAEFQGGIFTSPIVHSTLVFQKQPSTESPFTIISLIFGDSKLAVVSGNDLHLLKTIQLFAPLEAFKISLMHNINFIISEDLAHKNRQKELTEQLLTQRKDFLKFFPSEEKQEGSENDNKQGQTINDQDPHYLELMKAQYDIFVQASRETAKGLLEIQDVCYSGKQIVLIGYACGLVQKVTVIQSMISPQDECVFFNPLNLKQQSELDLILKEHEKDIKDDETVVVEWEDLHILKLKQVLCVNGTYVISVHQTEGNKEGDQVQTQLKSLIYVYEYQNGKKISYFEGPQNNIIKSLINNNEATHRNLLFIMDSTQNLYVYNYEKGTYLQSFNLSSSQLKQPVIDFSASFFLKTQMFAPVSDVYPLLNFDPKYSERTIEGDIIFYFTSNSQMLITQLDYQLQSATKNSEVSNKSPQIEGRETRSQSAIQIGQSQNQAPKKQENEYENRTKAASVIQPDSQAAQRKLSLQQKKILNQKMLKLFSSKIPCKYRCCSYSKKTDSLILVGEDGKVLRFSNFISSVFYFS